MSVSPVTLYQGETRVDTISVVDSAGAPKSLTGCTLHLVVRELDDTLVPSLTKATGSGIVHETQSGATLGKAKITWAHGDSAAVPFGQYKYVVYLIDATGLRDVVVEWSPFEVLDGEPVLPPVS